MTELEVAELLVSRWEGFRSVPYLCPAGVPTIGFGFTRYANGHAVLPFVKAAAQQTTDEAHAEITDLMNNMRSTLQRRPVDPLEGLL